MYFAVLFCDALFCRLIYYRPTLAGISAQ